MVRVLNIYPPHKGWTMDVGRHVQKYEPLLFYELEDDAEAKMGL